MATTIDQRLSELREEFNRGRQRMEDLERQRLDLRDTLLRISGAIQVLEELNGAERSAPTLAKTA